jgi:hypothetical protein
MNPVTKPWQSRLADWILATLSVLPVIAIVLFYLLVVHARWILGYWPSPDHPDPKSIASLLFRIHYGVIIALILATSVSPIAWLMALPMSEILVRLKTFLVRLFLYLVALATFLVMSQMDPGRFVNWFVD